MTDIRLLIKKLRNLNKEKLTIHDRLVVGIAIVTIALAAFMVAYLFWYSMNERSIAHFLPADKTVAYVEFKDMDLPQKLQTYPGFSSDDIQNQLKKFFDLDYAKAFSDWADPHFGVVAIKDDAGQATSLLFIKVGSYRKAMNFFQSLTLPGESLAKDPTTLMPVYNYPQGQRFVFSFVGPYVFLAPSADILKPIHEAYEGKTGVLTDEAAYQKTYSHLPRTSWMEGYVNVRELYFKDPGMRQLLDPLKYVVSNVGLSVRAEQNGFHFNTLLGLNPNLLTLKGDDTGKPLFSYKLSDEIDSKGLALYAGGINLGDEWINTLETISNLNPAYGLIMEGILRAQTSKIFGDDVDLRNDIYPLLQGEYALSVAGNEKGGLNMELILSHSNRKFVETKLAKLAQGFRMLASQFAPLVHTVTLPDNTTSRELVADSSRIVESDDTYEGYQVHCIEVTESNYGLCYSATDSLLILANRKDVLLKTIQITMKPEFVLSQDQTFRKTLSNLSHVSDEITYVNIQNALPLLSSNPYIMLAQNFFAPFEGATWVKHYFTDGVSAEGYLLIK